MVPGPWPLVPGPWPLAPGPWPLVPGHRQITVDRSHPDDCPVDRNTLGMLMAIVKLPESVTKAQACTSYIDPIGNLVACLILVELMATD